MDNDHACGSTTEYIEKNNEDQEQLVKYISEDLKSTNTEEGSGDKPTITIKNTQDLIETISDGGPQNISLYQHPKALDPESLLNDADPSSEDIKLEWDDDLDDDEERVFDDNFQTVQIALVKSEELSEDYFDKQNDSVEATDVTYTEIITSVAENVTELNQPLIDIEVTSTASVAESTIDTSEIIPMKKSDINPNLKESATAQIVSDKNLNDGDQKTDQSVDIKKTDLILVAKSINTSNLCAEVKQIAVAEINEIQHEICTEIENNKDTICSTFGLPKNTTGPNNVSEDETLKDNALEVPIASILKTNDSITNDDNTVPITTDSETKEITLENNIKDSTKPEPSTSTAEVEKSMEINTDIESVSKVVESNKEISVKEPMAPTLESTDNLVKLVKVAVSEHIEIEKESLKDCNVGSETEPSTSIADSKKIENKTDISIVESVASTSTANDDQMAPDASDQVPEMTDSLGLLAESTRRMDEEEDEDDEGDIDGDDDEDADVEADADDDQDDESNSNPQTVDHSEDSNAHYSETDVAKDQGSDIKISEVTFTGKLDPEEIQTLDLDLENIETKESPPKVDEKDVMKVEEPVEKCQEPEETLQVGIEETLQIRIEETLQIGSEDNEESEENEESEDKSTPEPTEESMDVDTVKLTDNSADEVSSETETGATDILKNQLVQDDNSAEPPAPSNDKVLDSPSKLKKLELTKSNNVMNYIDLEETSSEDVDVQEVPKANSPIPTELAEDDNVTNINLPKDLDVMSASSTGSVEIESKDGEIIIRGVPKAAPFKTTRLNTSEISIKTTTSAPDSKIVIPEVEHVQSQEIKSPKPKFGLEVFSIDSDEEDDAKVAKETEASEKAPSPLRTSPKSSPSKRKPRRCVNPNCSGEGPALLSPDPHVLRFYDVKRKRPYVCQPCSNVVYQRTWGLMEGLKSDMPLLELDMNRSSQELVEISDSDSDSESTHTQDVLASHTALMLEEHLADVLNETWLKYNLDDRLNEAKTEIDREMEDLEEQCKEIDAMLKECQMSTDAVRTELYNTFPINFKQLPPIELFDTPYIQFSKQVPENEESEVRRSKRPRHNQTSVKSVSAPEQKIEQNNSQDDDTKPVDDDNTDISVVKLSLESAPSWLPPLPVGGAPCPRPPLVPSVVVFAMKHDFGAWFKAKVLDVLPKTTTVNNQQFSMYRVRFENNGNIVQISARHLAYFEPAPVRLTIGTRVIALFNHDAGSNKRKAYYSGVIAEMPNPVNSYRYLVFFDDGYAQYVTHNLTRLVCECSPLVWDEVHPFSREFVRHYIHEYPERPMVRLHAGQTIKTEWNGKWWVSKVIKVDASLVQVYFEADNRTEWIYRGSTRLAPLYLELHVADKPRNRPLPRSHNRQNMPYVEYTRPDEQSTVKTDAQITQQQNEEIKRQRAVAKKSTSIPSQLPSTQPPDQVSSRVVFYTPKAAVKPHKMVAHKCSPRCKRSDVLPLKELRTYNPLARPLLSGWERQIVRFKGRKEIMYRAPCGRRLRSMNETHLYLRLTHSEMSVDLFDFALSTHCLAEFVLNKCFVSKKDLSHGKENVPVPCVNYIDNSLPEFCSYNTERTPTAGVPLNLDPEFLCGCDCEDDCMDKSKCACWKLTLDGARTIGLDGDDVGYVFKRLLDPVPSGIYECNSRCKCKQTCLNRVAQHPLQLKLQVFKTQNRGWGIRALNDIPRGAFLCVYAGNLLTDATANLDGLNEGDEYLAELDYIEVVEQMKEGFEADVPDADKLLDQNKSDSETDDASSPSDDENTRDKNDKEDDDFRPAYEIPQGAFQFNSKRLRRRDKRKKEKIELAEECKEKRRSDDCITISDDEELREPQSFSAQEGIGGNDLVSQYKSVRAHFGKDEACYIMDAKVQGNIGRYLNHSCQPNVFVQNVFVDTHDPRFPWVSFFALSYIRAGTELTWNYNYDVGSVPGKTLVCHCGAANCRGRLL